MEFILEYLYLIICILICFLIYIYYVMSKNNTDINKMRNDLFIENIEPFSDDDSKNSTDSSSKMEKIGFVNFGDTEDMEFTNL